MILNFLNDPRILEQKDVHIWRINLIASEQKIEGLFASLNNNEQRRADKFYFRQDRQRFIIARSSLRSILAQYLNQASQSLEFISNDFGKPALARWPELQFNLSHANDQALIAIARDASVGVDIEYCNRKVNMDGIAQRFFSTNEYQFMQTLSGVKKTKAFFTGWVRKEAFLKALGQGLSYSLDKVEMSLVLEQPQIIAIYDKQQDTKEWSLFNIPVEQDYLAALVVKGKNFTLKIHDLIDQGG